MSDAARVGSDRRLDRGPGPTVLCVQQFIMAYKAATEKSGRNLWLVTG